MMKFILYIFFLYLMVMQNKFFWFYYNLCYLGSFMFIFIYFFKDNLWINIGFGMGVNYYSILLLMLSVWILGLMMMCLEGRMEVMKMSMFMSLLIFLMFFFMSLDLLLFYFFFEVSLIPIFFLIIYWGVNPERLSAAYFMMMYMLLISFPLLLYILNMYLYCGTLEFNLMSVVLEFYSFSIWGYFLIYGAFFIKVPMYLMHIWLPKAHVEAPVYGSMILAGVLLKMGGYGIIRLLEIFFKSSVKYNYLIFSISLVGSLLVSVLCLSQVDMKSMVAYSSVVHMNMMLCSLLILCKLSILGGYIMMVAHGLCSSGMFYMVNLYYSRTLSRLMILNKGMMESVPSLSVWWFVLCLANFSFPFSVNFIGEVFMLGAMLNWEVTLGGFLALVCFFSSAYSLYLFSYIQHGRAYNESYFIMSVMKEKIILIFHVFPLVMMLLNLVLFM
uniref:NADH dehydrogenase subunit 4 n=1 Tax=Stenamma megamanni TaxID=1504014 RepID=UPI001FCD0813|nr:NADH dehydrogenase subunit 4 [Stenamma megamanni]UNZ99564.1 NADH dehydrogenase subunit 4 [Stenamma megamanni]